MNEYECEHLSIKIRVVEKGAVFKTWCTWYEKEPDAKECKLCELINE